MKYVCAVCMSIFFFYSICAAEESLKLDDERTKVSYSVGYQVGGDFKRQGLDINAPMLLKGVQDAMSGSATPLMTGEEMKSTLMDLQRSIVASREEEIRIESEKNLGEGAAFLEENGAKEGIVTLPSGLQYRIIKEGSGKSPAGTDMVTVHYRGTLIDGTEFDSSYKSGTPVTFRSDNVIAGWKEALPLMKEGGKWELFIPPGLAYGERRASGLIGPNSTLVFEVELISVKRNP